MGFGKNANNLPKTVWRTANGISEIPFAIIYQTPGDIFLLSGLSIHSAILTAI